MRRQDWTIDNVPRSFWDRIERADGDHARCEESLSRLSQEDVEETWYQYRGLHFTLFTEDYMVERGWSEDTAWDTAAKVVMGGEAFYRQIYNSPASLPELGRGPSFGETLVEHYLRRFGTWIP